MSEKCSGLIYNKGDRKRERGGQGHRQREREENEELGACKVHQNGQFKRGNERRQEQEHEWYMKEERKRHNQIGRQRQKTEMKKTKQKTVGEREGV